MWFQLHFLSLGYLQEFLYWYQNKCIKSTFLWDDLLFTLRFLFVFLNCRGKGVLKKNQLEWKCFFGVIRNSGLGYSVMHSLKTDLRAWTLSVIYTANIRGTNKQKTEQNFLESSLFSRTFCSEYISVPYIIPDYLLYIIWFTFIFSEQAEITV